MKIEDGINYVYIVECIDETLYTGWSNHLEQRIKNHNNGKGAKYTKGKRPVKLVFVQAFETKQQAMATEAKIKQMTRIKKLALIASQTNEFEPQQGPL